MKSNRYADFSSSRRLWNQFFTGAVWVAAVFVIILVVGIIGMVLVRGLPHVNWTFLTTTSSILRGTNGILPAIINTLYIILLTLVIVLPLGVGRGGLPDRIRHQPQADRDHRVHQRDPGRHPQHHLRPWWACWCSPRPWASRPACCPAA